MSIKLFTLEDKNQFLENIRTIRIEKKLSIEKLGKLSGMSKNTICSWLNNLSEPLTPSLLHFAQTLILLGIPLDNIFSNIKITGLGKNILKICAENSVSIQKLSEELNVKVDAIYSWINGLCNPSISSLLHLSKFFTTLDIPLEDVFVNTEISPLGISLFKLCAKNNINLKDFCYLLDLNVTVVNGWIYDTTQPTNSDLIYLTKCFIILDFPLEDIFINSRLTSLGENIFKFCTKNNIYITELCNFIDLDIICNWMYGKLKPRVSDLLCIAQNLVTLNLPLDNVLIDFEIIPLGRNILWFCSKANISILELSTKLNVSIDIMYKWIQGKIRPTKQTLMSIAEVLNISIENLLFGVETPFEKFSRLSDGITPVSKLAEICQVSQRTIYNWKSGFCEPIPYALKHLEDYVSSLK